MEMELKSLTDKVSRHDNELKSLRRTMYGENGEPESSMVTELVLLKQKMTDLIENFGKFQNRLWAVLLVVITFVVIGILESVFKSDAEIAREVIVNIVTATPIP